MGRGLAPLEPRVSVLFFLFFVSPASSSPRFVWVTLVTEGQEGAVLAVSQSLRSHPQAPERPDQVVRGVLAGDLACAEPLPGGRCRVTVLTAVDPMGYIPAAVVNMVSKQNGNSLAVARAVLAKK